MRRTKVVYRRFGNWEFDFDVTCWNPLNNISFCCEVNLHVKDFNEAEEVSPSFYLVFKFICLSVELFIGKEDW